MLNIEFSSVYISLILTTKFVHEVMGIVSPLKTKEIFL
jgi:hypothetical protein